MSDDKHPALGLLLIIFILILTGSILWAINASIGAYLTLGYWLGVGAVIGIFDIYVFIKVWYRN